MNLGFQGWLVVAFFVLAFANLVYFVGRRDKRKPPRPHTTPEEGGDSFGDTTHWGGHGRPGSGGFGF